MIAAIFFAALTLSDASPREIRIAMRIAALESGFRRDVVTCRVLGDGGRARGIAQIHPRSDSERRDACDITHVVPLLLARIRESERVCAHLPPLERGAAFTSGSCSNRGGRAASRARWSE